MRNKTLLQRAVEAFENGQNNDIFKEVIWHYINTTNDIEGIRNNKQRNDFLHKSAIAIIENDIVQYLYNKGAAAACQFDDNGVHFSIDLLGLRIKFTSDLTIDFVSANVFQLDRYDKSFISESIFHYQESVEFEAISNSIYAKFFQKIAAFIIEYIK